MDSGLGVWTCRIFNLPGIWITQVELWNSELIPVRNPRPARIGTKHELERKSRKFYIDKLYKSMDMYDNAHDVKAYLLLYPFPDVPSILVSF